MEITNVIISNSLNNFLLENKALSIFLGLSLFVIIIFIGIFFSNIQKTEKVGFCISCLSIIPIMLFCCPAIAFNWNPEVYDPSWGYDDSGRFGYDNYYSVFDGRTDKYIVEYNIENSKKETMTTQEIIDTIYNKKYFEDKKEKTSKVVIYVKGRENIKLIKQILRMNDNTNFIKEREQKEKEQEEDNEFLNETHVIDTKR